MSVMGIPTGTTHPQQYKHLPIEIQLLTHCFSSSERMTLKEPLIVHSEREIPQEVMWHLQDGKEHRDSTIPNRYWFKFPEQWYNQCGKDPILGIRSIYIAKTIRHLSFKVYVMYWDLDDDYELHYIDSTTGETKTLEFDFTTTTYLDTDDTIRKACQHFATDCATAFSTAFTSVPDSTLLQNKDLPTMTYNLQTTDDNGQDTHYGTLTFSTPANNESMTYTNSIGTEVSVEQRITIEPLSDDFDKMFDTNNSTATATSEVYPILWDHYQCFVKSSISALTTDQYLGHTRSTPYTPIKYFRINTREQSFYVDLFSTRNHSAYVTLPDDNRDDLIIEGIVCFDSSAII